MNKKTTRIKKNVLIKIIKNIKNLKTEKNGQAL